MLFLLSAGAFAPLRSEEMTTVDYLQANDSQLRTEAETPSAIASERLGPLRLVRFTGGRGFITYPHFDEADSETVRGLVRNAVVVHC